MRVLSNLLIIALVAAIAGCTNPEGEALDDQATDTTPTPPAPASPTSGRPTPTSPTSPAQPTSPTSAPSSGSNTTAPPAPATVVVEGDSGALLMLALPDPVGSAGLMVGFAVLDIPRASPDDATLVAAWTSATPLDTSMEVRLMDTDGNLIASGSGASPLTIEINGEAFASAVELRGMAYPTAPGVAIEQSVHFALTVNYA